MGSSSRKNRYYGQARRAVRCMQTTPLLASRVRARHRRWSEMIQGTSLVVMALSVVLPLALDGCTTSPRAAKDGDSTKTAAAAKDESKSALGRLFESRREFVIPEGTAIRVTVDETLSSNNSHVGDIFAASTSEPVVIDGNVVIPKGAKVSGRVVDAKESGRLHVPARLAVALNSIEVDSQGSGVRCAILGIN